ncbi:hypothetical protein UlMin_007389 [Ulmus minor]
MAELVFFGLTEKILDQMDSIRTNMPESWIVSGAFPRFEIELSSIRDVLLDAEKRADENQNVRDWLKEVGDLLFEADDLVAELSAEELPRQLIRKVRIFFSSSNQLAFEKKMFRKFNDINEKLYKLNSSAWSDHGLMEMHDDYSGPSERKREPHSFVPQEEIIGRDEDKETIIEQLLSANVFLTVIPIVGMGGLGKTALAQLVFDDHRVQQHFEQRLWVHVSDNYHSKVTVTKLSRSATGENNQENLDVSRLYDLGDVMDEKRFLLVLDDMWDACGFGWADFFGVVGRGASGGSIIVTTRNQVQDDRIFSCSYATLQLQIHKLGVLDETSSLELFLKVARREGPTLNDVQTREMGRQIVRKCGGNPLAIKAIGSMLCFKDPETEWQPFIDKDLLMHQNEEMILSSLRLSYDHLPSHLKTCFAYCILFPKDYEIDVQTLVNLWISQGFVKSLYLNQDSLTAGYEYFVELLQRSFFHEARMDEWGQVTKCKMQNLMHDLAEVVAGEVTIRYDKKDIGRRTHHMSFDHHVDSPWQIPTSLTQAKKMRTIILPCQLGSEVEGKSGTSICDEIVSKFKFVRALDLHNSGIKKVSKSIGKLKHLRYLDLSQNGDIRVLPNSIGRLQYLDTLKLNYCSKLEELPISIKSLVNLRNLEIGSCCSLTHMPRGLGQLTKLETLSEFVLNKGNGSTSKQCGELGELSELNQLKGELRIKNLRPGEDTGPANLEEKQNLQSLILMWDIDAAVAANDTQDISTEGLQPHPALKELALCAYGGVELPSWLPSLENLVKFSLWGCMKCVHLPSSLNHLPHLKTLVLDDMPDMKYIQGENASTTFFPSLEELRLTNLPNLKGWCATEEEVNVEEMATFHCLSKLIIEDCSELTFMPHFPNLQELLLKRTSWDPFQQSKPTATESSSSSSVDHTSSGYLSKLRTLSIVHMPINGDLNIWHSLKALCSLTFDNVPLVKSLLEGLQELTSLQELRIWRCDSMEEIPEWISNDRSSLRLSIRLCPNLKIAPDRIGAITSLKNVDIEDCPRIAHIEILHKHRLFSEVFRISLLFVHKSITRERKQKK